MCLEFPLFFLPTASVRFIYITWRWDGITRARALFFLFSSPRRDPAAKFGALLCSVCCLYVFNWTDPKRHFVLYGYLFILPSDQKTRRIDCSFARHRVHHPPASNRTWSECESTTERETILYSSCIDKDPSLRWREVWEHSPCRLEQQKKQSNFQWRWSSSSSSSRELWRSELDIQDGQQLGITV